MDTNNDNDLLTPSEAARVLGVKAKTVSHWAVLGKIPAIRTLGGHHRFRRTDIERLAPDPSQPSAWVKDAVRLYDEGSTIVQLAARYGLPYPQMHTMLQHHTTIRSRQNNTDNP